MKGVMLKEINAYPQCPAFTALWKNVKLTKLNDEDSVFAEITMLTDKVYVLTYAYDFLTRSLNDV